MKQFKLSGVRCVRSGLPVLVLTTLILNARSAAAQTYEPIYVVFSYHLDPLGPNAAAAAASYPDHRGAVQWATNLSLSTGLKLSAGSTGPYAEGCVLNGHEADFLTFMPGGHNALGTHLHAHRKLPGFVDYQWQDVGGGEQPPLLTAEVFADQIAYVNAIFTALGLAATDNEFFHGTHARSSGAMEQLYSGGGIPPFTYPNVFSILGAIRGLYHPYRGGADTGEDPAGAYVKLPITGGIAGRDELHGPEGMLYGTLPYLKKDFTLEYLEWRYAQSHGLLDRVWVFGWGSHPYQTTPTYLGTDGVPVRQTIADIVTWLNGSFIEQPSAEGNVIARFATYLEVRDRFLQWEIAHPGESSIDGDINGPNHQLTATAGALATSYYDAEIVAAPAVEVHQFTDRDDGTVRYVAWTDSPPQTLDLSGQVTGLTAVIDHTGAVTFEGSAGIPLFGDPLVIVAATLGDADLDGDVDLTDYGALAPCLTGPDAGPLGPGCAVFDFESDDDVDVADFAAFAVAFTG